MVVGYGVAMVSPLKGLSNKIDTYPHSFRCGLNSFVPRGGTHSLHLSAENRLSP